MFLSKRSNGVYYLWFKNEDGKKQKLSTGTSIKSEALKFLLHYKGEIHKDQKAQNSKTLNQFYAEYLKYSESIHTPKTQHSIKNSFREFIRILGDVPLGKIGVREVELFLAQKKAEASAWTAKKYYTHLASAFQTAVRWNYLSSNPFKHVVKPKTIELVPLYFSKDEFRKLYEKINREEYREICITALYTGLRLGELTNLQWVDIDLTNRILLVRNREGFTTKTRKNRTIPLNESVYTLLMYMKTKASCDFVFHDKKVKLNDKRVSKRFKVYVRKAELNDKLHFHSLRHTFASWLVQAGVSLYEVQRLLGHSNISVTMVYAHLQPEKLHDTVNKIIIDLNS